ncbi:hypothetical protein BG58_37295 [Caballeronia jiangsuensis]|nr:hypothetical protein BG58_37295 [Caballeronia jiangsuensis]
MQRLKWQQRVPFAARNTPWVFRQFRRRFTSHALAQADRCEGGPAYEARLQVGKTKGRDDARRAGQRQAAEAE